MYVVGAVVGQLPFTFIFPMFPMNYTIPALELGWGIFTLLQYRTETFAELMAYRFLVGLFEVRASNVSKCKVLTKPGCILPWGALRPRSLVSR